MITIRIGDLLGESIQQGRAGEIDVLACSWQVEADAVGAGKPSIGPLTITKRVDKSSSELILLACTGGTVSEAILTFSRFRQEGWFDYIKIALKDVRIAGLKLSHAESADAPVEVINIAFASIRFKYVQETATGAIGPSAAMSWTRPTAGAALRKEPARR